ncbi:phosphatase PAP2 family protein [Amnibacterium endophyticum]|uniref:Phosphatase PAP2 family protein n=1 Tax=Amnibacterium endophyticum TaxID=2109337 RepID=A0ABW4LGG7_9MICO
MRTPPASPSSSRRSLGRRDVTEWRSRSGQRLLEAQRRLAARRNEPAAIATTLAIGGAAAVAGVWATTFLYDAVADQDGIARLDRPALAMAKRLRGPLPDGAAALTAHLFGPIGMPALAAVAGAALSLRARDPLPLITVAAAGAGSLLMTLGGKGVVDRHRPPRRDAIPPFEHSPSFPSGHTLNATVVAGTVAYLLMLEQRENAPQILTSAAATAVTASVGLSRVLLGAHWFTDVLTGWAAGAGWLATVVTAHRLHLTLSPSAPDGR